MTKWSWNYTGERVISQFKISALETQRGRELNYWTRQWVSFTNRLYEWIRAWNLLKNIFRSK